MITAFPKVKRKTLLLRDKMRTAYFSNRQPKLTERVYERSSPLITFGVVSL